MVDTSSNKCAVVFHEAKQKEDDDRSVWQNTDGGVIAFTVYVVVATYDSEGEVV